MQERTFPAIIASIPQVTAWIDGALEELGCSMKAQMQLDVAIDEIFGNIAYYAYRGKIGSAKVQLALQEDTRMLSITFMDQGIPFNPLSQKEPDTSLKAEKRKIGGLGIFLVKKIMDEKGVAVAKVFVEEFATSMEMQGLSLTAFKLDAQLKGLLLQSARTPFVAV